MRGEKGARREACIAMAHTSCQSKELPMTRTSNSSRPLYISMSTACEQGGIHVILPSATCH